MPIAAAIAGAAVLGAGVSMSANNKAAKTARDTAAKSNALQTDIFNQNKAILGPYVEQGAKVTPTINGLLGLGDAAAATSAFDTFKNSTGYASRLAEGQKAVTAALGGRGLLDSGAALKGLTKFGQGFASNEFGSFLGALTGQQQVGLTATGRQAELGQNYANGVSANDANAANVQANAYLANGSAINGALSNIVGAFGVAQGLSSSYKGSSGGQGGLLSGIY